MKPRIIWVMTIYEKNNDTLVKEYPIKGIQLAELQRLFNERADNPMFDCYPVGPDQVAKLEKVTGVSIDLTKYDYFVECHVMEKEDLEVTS